MFDKYLPVKMEAALALAKIVKSNPKSKGLFLPVLKELVQSFLTIMNDMNAEELFQSFEVIMDAFADNVVPYAQQIIQQLIATYLEIANMDGIDEYSSEWMRAGCAIKAATRVLQAITDQGL